METSVMRLDGVPGRTKRYRIVALVPAYQEEKAIAATVLSLKSQTRKPDYIFVIPNNCTDRTAEKAREAGAYVIEMPGPNPDKKAGAINYALDKLHAYISESPWNTAVLVMDGDTTLAPDFLEIAEKNLTSGVGGVGGTFAGRETDSIIGYLQRMEYHRYGKTAKRYGNRAFVLTGTGTLFSYQALLDVREQRRVGRLLPKGESFYDTHSLTEDNELTFALQAIGYDTLSPDGMYATTDVMESVSALDKQRRRWYLGALRNLSQYGRRMPMYMRWIYWRQQAGLLLSAIVAVTYLLMVGVSYALLHGIQWNWWWSAPTLVLVVERTWSVWTMGWKARLLAVTFVPEQVFTMLLTYIFARSFIDFVRGRKGMWHAT